MHKILVIDDDDWVRVPILATLQRNGFATIEAADGASGLALAHEHQPDLVLSDVNLPDVSGYELLRLLRSAPGTSGIPLILMTGDTNTNDVRYSMEQGADDYLPKPIGAATLMKAIQTRLDRKLAVELQIQKVSSRLLAIVDASPNLVAILEGSPWRLGYINAAGRAMLGAGRDEPTSQIHIQDHFRDKDSSVSFDSLLEIAKSAGEWMVEGHVINRQRHTLPVEIRVLAPEAGFEKANWLSILARDLTQIIQLRQAHKMEGIGRLAAGVAHEINTPIQFTQHNLHFISESFGSVAKAVAAYERLFLAAKSGVISPELLSEISQQIAQADMAYLKEEIEAAMTDAMTGTERVAKIVKAMKEFSHPGARQGEKPEAADLNQAIASTITVAQNEWKYAAEVTTEFDPAMPRVPIIVGEFNQVILNLLVNAAHAIAAANAARSGKGTITIRTQFAGDWAEVSIQDSGTGIPENVRHRIFEPFFTTKEIGKGTGQGLALARAVIVEKHKGSIRFETEMGKGTRFIIQLPLKNDEPAKN